ncbi:hypothetical protein [Spirillospora sp. NPDC029432]|uniref:hypothetical protein n=1 Tax=Spirillospora sp. NPDC029432 TaxID=3154599 RepID=UPI003453560C
MSRSFGRSGRRAAAVAAFTALCAVAPLSAAQAAEHGPWQRWRYVDTFGTEPVCEKAGELLMIFGEARDYRCVERRDGYALFTRSGRYDRD